MNFQLDPPITSSVQQAKYSAGGMKRKVLAVDLVIFSPQTRAIEFDAILLLDQQLEEVLRGAFLIRFWKSAKSLCRIQLVKAYRAVGKTPLQ